MAKRIVWSANALSDRILILEYWHQRIGNKEYSKRLDKSLKEAINHLAQLPAIGRKLEKREERFLIKDAYQIFYLIELNEIHIVHIWDSRRNPVDLFQ